MLKIKQLLREFKDVFAWTYKDLERDSIRAGTT
jgi:hypothetical protein